jgi:large subunit ribosomal protein L22
VNKDWRLIVAEVVNAENQARAIAKYVRVAPRKVAKVIELIKGKNVDEALDILKFCPQAAAKSIEKVVTSAMANAETNSRLRRDSLIVSQAYVDQGPTLKRFRHRAMGRASRIHKRTSHITIVVEERGGK